MMPTHVITLKDIIELITLTCFFGLGVLLDHSLLAYRIRRLERKVERLQACSSLGDSKVTHE